MSNTWRRVRLGDICRLINGRAYKQPELLASGKYPVLRVGNFFSNRSWYHSDLELEADKYCDDGDLLYAWSASFGPKIWSGGKVIYHYHIWKAAPNAKFVDKMYLYYWFYWDSEQIKQDHGAGTTMIHVTKGSMEERELMLPPLPEQKRIVAILDEAFEGISTAIANTEKNLANARELFLDGLNAAFAREADGGKWISLGQVADVNYGFTAKAMSVGDGPKFLRITDIQDGSVDWSDVPTCQIVRGEFKRHQLVDGDIVFARTGATTGKSFLISSPPKSIAASYLIRCRLKDPSFLPTFVARYFQTRTYWEHVSSGTTGSAQGGFNASKLAQLPIPVLSVAEQQELVRRSDMLSAHTELLRITYRKKAAMLVELKQSILQRAFAGELTTRSAANALEAAE